MFNCSISYNQLSKAVLCGVLATIGIIFFGPFLESNAQSRQLSLADILIALRSKKAVIEEKNRILADAVKDRGITFALTPEIEKELATTGAYPILIDAIRDKVAGPKPVDTKPADSIPAVPAVVAQPTFESYRQSAAKHIEKGATDLAIADLGKAIEIKPADQYVRVERAKALISQDKFDVAVQDLDKAIEIEPRSVWLELRAQVKEKLKMTDAAMADYKRAVELDAANLTAANAVKRIELENRKAEPMKVEPPKTEPVVVVSSKPVTPEVVAGPPDVGPLNLFASRLAQPLYTELDRRMGLQGRVTVQATLDEKGKLISVEATSGPKGLKRAAEEAVKKSRFNPVIVEGSPAKVTGYIVYNFVRQ